MIVDYVLLAVVCYLIGAIPWGYIVGKAQGIDVRRHGSGRTGATNALRTLGTRSSALVFAADTVKGVVVVLVARYTLQSPSAEVVAALSAMIGHNWSIYIGFSGGRGVVVSFGSMTTMSPLTTALGLLVFTPVIVLTRYVSLSSIIGVCSMPLISGVLLWLGIVPAEYFFYTLVGVSLIVYAHRDNIERLRTGRESKLGERAKVRES